MSNQENIIFEGPALTAEVPRVSLATYIRSRATARPEHLALINGATGQTCTYAQMDHEVGRVAAGLVAQGLRPGDVMLMFAPNSPQWAIVAIATLVAGGVVSGANPAYAAGDLRHQVQDAGARFVFTDVALLPTVQQACDGLGCSVVATGAAAPDAISYDSLVACTDAEPVVAIDPDSLAALPYSSGTTGLPKGVMLTHATLVSNVVQYLQARPLDADAVALCVLPMFHIFGFTVITLGVLAGGGTLVTLPRFEPESFLQCIPRYRVTHLSLVPPLLQFMAVHPLVERYDMSSLRQIGCGAAPLGEAMEQRATQRLGCTVLQGFGMTESSGVISLMYPGHLRAGSSGQLLPGTSARVVDTETGLDLPRGQAGEFWIRGPQIFKGYLNQPQASAGTLTTDGWMRTGDIGYIDDAGYLYVTDRLKELIKVKGFQVAPAELEALLVTHPNVADVAVIGRADERAGEVPVAFVVPRGELQPQALKDWLAERMVDYKHLADVFLCDAVPKTASGKILRRVLRERLRAMNA